MIKTVILDLGNVIVPVDFRRCHASLSQVCALPPEEIPKLIRKTGLVERFETGQATPDDFMREISSVLNMNVTSAQFWEIWSSIFAPEPLIPEAMLESLRRERRLLLLSNTNSVHFEMIQERFPLLRHFHHHVLSYEVGAMKPSPRIYKEAITHAGCLPAECFFADDMALFVEGARQQGIDAVQFHSLEQLQGELRVRSISW